MKIFSDDFKKLLRKKMTLKINFFLAKDNLWAEGHTWMTKGLPEWAGWTSILATVTKNEED